MSNKIKGALLGLIVGDALGVPVEFETRETLAKNPINDMIGFGTFNLVGPGERCEVCGRVDGSKRFKETG
jgi:ADP-ribosylglycohydrolase